MHEFRVDFSECSFSEQASDYANLVSVQVMLAVGPSALASFARITRIMSALADSVRPDPTARERSMHELRVDISECSFSE
jgi:hypothetical protein